MANEQFESGNAGGSSAATFETASFNSSFSSTDNTSTTADRSTESSSILGSQWFGDGNRSDSLNTMRQLNDTSRGASDASLGLPTLTIEDPTRSGTSPTPPADRHLAASPMATATSRLSSPESAAFNTSAGQPNGTAFDASPTPPADRHLISSPPMKATANPAGPVGSAAVEAMRRPGDGSSDRDRSGMASLVRANDSALGQSPTAPQNADVDPAIGHGTRSAPESRADVARVRRDAAESGAAGRTDVSRPAVAGDRSSAAEPRRAEAQARSEATDASRPSPSERHRNGNHRHHIFPRRHR